MSVPPSTLVQAESTSNFHEDVRKGKRVLSYSQISTFLSCRHKWYLTYYLGLHTLRPSDPLVLGDLTHQAIAASLTDGSDPEQFIVDKAASLVTGTRMDPDSFLSSSTQDALIDSTDQLITSALYATRTALRVIHNNGWIPLVIGESDPTPVEVMWGPPKEIPPVTLGRTIKAIELELRTELPFAPAFEYFASHLDAIFYHPPTNRRWLIDYKIRKQFTNRVFEDVNLQAMLYALMCMFHGIPITGTGTLEISAIPPAIPKQNQDGSMSRAKIATTWEIYRNELERCWLNPSDYEEMRWKLNTPFHRLTTEFRPPTSLERIWQKIVVPTAELMSIIMQELDQTHVSSSIHRNLGPFQCNGCGVRDVCLAGLYDRDIEHTLHGRDGRVDAINAAIKSGQL